MFKPVFLGLGDGNCLLHAVSLAMWSIADDQTNLRRLLHATLITGHKNFFSRWKKRQEAIDLQEGGMTHSKQVISISLMCYFKTH